MKISKRQLRRIIREEKANVIAEQRFRKVVRAALIAESKGELDEGFLDKLKGFIGKGKKKGMSEEDAKKLGAEMNDLRDEVKDALKKTRGEEGVAKAPDLATKILRLHNQREVLQQLADQLAKMKEGAFGTDNPELVDELEELQDSTEMVLSFIYGANDREAEDVITNIESMEKGSQSDRDAAERIRKGAERPYGFDSLSAPF